MTDYEDERIPQKCHTRKCLRSAYKKGLCVDCYDAAEEDRRDGEREDRRIEARERRIGRWED